MRSNLRRWSQPSKPKQQRDFARGSAFIFDTPIPTHSLAFPLFRRYVTTASYRGYLIPVSILNIDDWSEFEAMICAGMLGMTGTAWLEIRTSWRQTIKNRSSVPTAEARIRVARNGVAFSITSRQFLDSFLTAVRAATAAFSNGNPEVAVACGQNDMKLFWIGSYLM